jgi:type IV pilus assembly protein PilA
VTILSTPFIFNKVAEAQVSPKLKASESEGKQSVSSMNKAQQSYGAENGKFTSSIANLGIGIKPETANYQYSISTENKAVFNYGVSRNASLRSFVGGVFFIRDTKELEMIFAVAILCQTNAASMTKPANPTNKNGTVACGANTEQVAQLLPRLKASESESKQYVSSMNRAQQAYYAENTGFTSSVANLGLGVKAENANYKYSIGTGNKAAFNYGVSRDPNFRSFVGGVFLIGNTTKAILCQTNAASTTKPANPINQNGTLVCGVNTTPVR